jgi:hypothetical protein
MQHGSPLWQMLLFFAGFLFLIWEIWRGWRVGFVRSGVHFGAILVSTSLGVLAAKLAALPFGGLGNLPGFLAGALAGGGLGILLFGTIWILGALIFKRTDHQPSGVFRILWGAGGAFFGLLVGLAVLWGAISIVRILGTFAESRVEARQNKPRPTQPGVAGALVTLKESLELGSARRFLDSVDALPPDFYERVLQIGKLTGDQQAISRLLEYPGIQDIAENPRVVDLMNDPGVIRAWKEKNVFLLLNNKSVAAAIKDPVLAEQLKTIDLWAALKFALESHPAPHSPSAAPSPTKRK